VTTVSVADLLSGARLVVATADQTHALGVQLGGLLRAGDLVLLTGDLAAGKTTLTQGIGEGLGVRGPVTSPTFVIARMHPNLGAGPALVHVDAYRLGGLAELDDLDLDADLAGAVTVVEWGHGMAEALSEDRLEITLARVDDATTPGDASGDEDGIGMPTDQPRTVRATGHGARWTEEGRA
jgi:tRNA threonylcarbamoyladenosine biosynthesis protein TsaE